MNVLVTHRGYSVQEALTRWRHMHNRAIDDMVRLRAAVETLGPHAVLAYVRGLEHWIRGHIEYSLGSARYIGCLADGHAVAAAH